MSKKVEITPPRDEREAVALVYAALEYAFCKVTKPPIARVAFESGAIMIHWTEGVQAPDLALMPMGAEVFHAYAAALAEIAPSLPLIN
jgi:hypothetical protein